MFRVHGQSRCASSRLRSATGARAMGGETAASGPPGTSSDWFLERVVVRDERTKAVWNFPFSQSVLNAGSNRPQRERYALGVSAHARQQHARWGSTLAWPTIAILLNLEPFTALLGWLTKAKPAAHLTPETEPSVTYRLTVFTADEEDAGAINCLCRRSSAPEWHRLRAPSGRGASCAAPRSLDGGWGWVPRRPVQLQSRPAADPRRFRHRLATAAAPKDPIARFHVPLTQFVQPPTRESASS